MALEAPSMEQAGLISVIFSVGGFWFNSYLAAPPKKLKNNFDIEEKSKYDSKSKFDYNNDTYNSNEYNLDECDYRQDSKKW